MCSGVLWISCGCTSTTALVAIRYLHDLPAFDIHLEGGKREAARLVTAGATRQLSRFDLKVASSPMRKMASSGENANSGKIRPEWPLSSLLTYRGLIRKARAVQNP